MALGGKLGMGGDRDDGVFVFVFLGGCGRMDVRWCLRSGIKWRGAGRGVGSG